MNYFHTISKLELESIILEKSRFVKGFNYERLEGISTPIKTFGFDKDLNAIKLDNEKCSKTIKFLGVNYKLSILEDQKLEDKFVPFHNCIFGEFEGTFVDKEGKIYKSLFAPIITEDNNNIDYLTQVFGLYTGNKTSDISFYLPGITKELEKYGIHIIKINEQNTSKILIKTFTIFRNNTMILMYVSKSDAIKCLHLLNDISLYEIWDRPKIPVFKLHEDSTNVDVYYILNLMNEHGITIEDIKVKHSGLSAAHHSGLFENSSLQILKDLKIIN